MIQNEFGYIIDLTKRESLNIIASLDNTLINGTYYTTYTLPKFLKITDRSNLTQVIVLDLLKIIKINDDFKTTFKKTQPFELSNKDVYLVYLHFFKNTLNEYNQRELNQSLIEMIIEEKLIDIIHKNFKVNSNNPEFINVSPDELTELLSLAKLSSLDTISQQIISYKKEQQYYMNNIFPLHQITPLPLTDFTKTFENISIVFDTQYNLSTLFDRIECDLVFPFCTYNNYIKIIKNFDVSKQNKWLEMNYKNLSIRELISIAKRKKITIYGSPRKEALIQKIIDFDQKNNLIYDYKKDVISIKHIKQERYNKKDKKTTIDMYNECHVYNKNNKTVIDLQIDSINKNFIIQSLLSLLELSNQSYSINIRSFSGKLYLISDEQDYYLHYGLFSHLCLNTQYFILINEFMNASTTLNSLKLQYLDDKTIKSSIKNNMINKFTKNIDTLKSFTNKKLFIEINILDCLDIDKLNLYKIDLGIMFKLYFDKLDELIKLYTDTYSKIRFPIPFNKDINKPIVVEYKQSEMNAIIDSKMQDSTTTFVSVCPSKRKKPLKIDNETSIEELNQIYPFNDYFFTKEDTGDKQYMLWPKDDPENFILFCQDDSNPSIYNYPGITPNNYPCCFKDNQIRTVNKEEHKPNIKSYYYDIKQQTTTSYKKGPKKLLKKDEEGDVLTNILILIGQDAKRIGVQEDDQSFLTCINTKMDVKVENIEDVLIVSKQSNFDKTIEDITAQTNSFIDARNFTTLFEYIYDVYIITFDIFGKLIQPNHKHGYIDYYFPNRKFLFLYENITQTNKKQYEYITNISTSENYFSLLSYRFNFYHLSKPLLPYTIPPFNVLAQYIDNFGKCRIIKIKFNNVDVFVQTYLPPLSINYKNILQDTDIPKITMDVFQQIKSLYNLIIISQYTINNKTTEIYTKYNSSKNSVASDLFFTFNINSDMLFSNINHHPFQKIISNNTTIFDTFIYHKKSADCLMQFSLYLYSFNLSLSVDDFINTQCVTKQNHTYTLSKSFNNNTFIDNNNKLIITFKNEENKKNILQKLTYYIKCYRYRMMPELIKYKEKKTLDTFYFSISDFKIYPNQSLTSFSKLSSFNKSYEYIKIMNEKNNIPFFTNFKEKLVLAFDFLSLSNALYNSQNWINNNFNYIYSDRYQTLRDYTIFDTDFNILKQVGSGDSAILFREYDNDKIFTSVLFF